MIHGLYLSAQGANAQVVRQDVISNNLANASTTGFKRDVTEFRFHRPQDLRHGMPVRMQNDRHLAHGAITVDRTTTVHHDAPLESTGREYDVALRGDGFLKVLKDGQQFLTRDGRMRRGNDGTLLTEDGGLQVLGTDDAPVTVPVDAASINIATDGTLSAVSVDGKSVVPIDQIGLFTAPHDRMVKAGQNLFSVDPQQIEEADGATMHQNFIEASGVEPTRELISLIDASRTFETNVNLLRLQDESLGRLLQSVSG